MEPSSPSSSGASRTLVCTVLFVDIVNYSQKPVTQQVAMKAHVNQMIADALAHVVSTDRILLDTGDGAALCFLGDPEDAMFAANSLRGAVLTTPGPEVQLRLGINLGPVRLVKDVNGNPNILGDGINVSQRVMSFAAPNQILVSRSYYEVVSRLSQEYAQLFQFRGVHRDKHVREHEVYEVNLGGGSVGAAPAAAGAPETPPAGGPPLPPEALARLTAALLPHLGPVAKLVVRRAAEHAPDPHELCAELAASLPEAHRTAFLAEVSELAGPGPAARAAGPAAARAGDLAEAPVEWTPALLASAEQALAQHIGPLARMLVRNAAKHATGVRDLYERLAVHIESPAARKAFIDAGVRSRP
jgi:class 3 adenylate cyclase